MEYREEDYLMLSGIQHFQFCRRQWCLIHIEQLWAENLSTTEGKLAHENAHDPFFTESRKETIYSRAMPVHSRELGISGECDVVEFHKNPKGISIFGREGLYTVYPIEYKKGKSKQNNCDILQLTAEAMCLEEMFQTDIVEGALYFVQTRSRLKVTFTQELRKQVKDIFAEMHGYVARGYTAKATYTQSCKACSLYDLCLPQLIKQPSAKAYNTKNVETL